MKKCLFIPLCMLFLLPICFFGCERKDTAQSVLNAVCVSETALPAGGYYLWSPSDHPSEISGDSSPFRTMDSTLFSALFGNGTLPAEADCILEGACYFAYTEPYEISVFLCKSAAEAERVAKLCLRRLDLLRTGYDKRENADRSFAEHSRILRSGRWVLLCVSKEPEETCRAFRRAL